MSLPEGRMWDPITKQTPFRDVAGTPLRLIYGPPPEALRFRPQFSGLTPVPIVVYNTLGAPPG